MKYFNLFSLFRTAFAFTLLSISVACFSQHEGHGGGGTTTHTDTETENYHYVCPMHPEIGSDKPGNCVKCGMKLEQKKIEESKPGKRVYYYCQNHPSFQSDKKGKCTICGRKLKKAKEFFYEWLEAPNSKLLKPAFLLIKDNNLKLVPIILKKQHELKKKDLIRITAVFFFNNEINSLAKVRNVKTKTVSARN
jgi:hypothetical protein